VQGMQYIIIMLWCGVVGGVIGRIKGSSFFIWFLVSASVPVLGVIVAICYRWDNRELRRQCPGCRRVLKLHDAVCTNCGEELEFPEVALAPAAGMQPSRGPGGAGTR
jgi:hypothetical protein